MGCKPRPICRIHLISHHPTFTYLVISRDAAGLSFENPEELLAVIEKVTLRAVFLEWVERLRKCIVTNGECVE
jgi:hypothetical protein